MLHHFRTHLYVYVCDEFPTLDLSAGTGAGTLLYQYTHRESVTILCVNDAASKVGRSSQAGLRAAKPTRTANGSRMRTEKPDASRGVGCEPGSRMRTAMPDANSEAGANTEACREAKRLRAARLSRAAKPKRAAKLLRAA